MAFGSYSRSEVLTKLAEIDGELEDARVPDGATGKTRLAFAELRSELRRQRKHWQAVLRHIDGDTDCGRAF